MSRQKHDDLWDGFPTFNRLIRAFYRAARSKFDRDAVLRFHLYLEPQILKIKDHLLNETYQWGVYRQFWVIDPKLRLIESAPFRDRIVHQALVEVLEPILDPSLYYHSYACRTGRGTHAAMKQLHKWVSNKPELYCLQMDVTKFFPSIDRTVLFSIIEKKIADEKILRLIQSLIFSAPGTNGLPIGNLTSQLFANLYLDPLDQFIKRTLRAPYYIRYMDDIAILAPDLKTLVNWRHYIDEFAREALKLQFNPTKIALGKASDGISFVGFRIFPNGIYTRGKSLRRFRKKMNAPLSLDEQVKRYMSYYGHLLHAKDGAYRMKEFRDMIFKRYQELN